MINDNRCKSPETQDSPKYDFAEILASGDWPNMNVSTFVVVGLPQALARSISQPIGGDQGNTISDP